MCGAQHQWHAPLYTHVSLAAHLQCLVHAPCWLPAPVPHLMDDYLHSRTTF